MAGGRGSRWGGEGGKQGTEGEFLNAANDREPPPSFPSPLCPPPEQPSRLVIDRRFFRIQMSSWAECFLRTAAPTLTGHYSAPLIPDAS